MMGIIMKVKTRNENKILTIEKTKLAIKKKNKIKFS